MTKNKKNSSDNTKKTGVGIKKKRARTVWDHHDTMIVNLRMWIDREIEYFNNDIRTHAQELIGKPKLAAALEKAQSLNTQLWDQIRIAQEIADTHEEMSR